MAVDIQPVTSTIGAEIHGLDLTRPLEPEDVDAVAGAPHRHGVVAGSCTA